MTSSTVCSSSWNGNSSGWNTGFEGFSKSDVLVNPSPPSNGDATASRGPRLGQTRNAEFQRIGENGLERRFVEIQHDVPRLAANGSESLQHFPHDGPTPGREVRSGWPPTYRRSWSRRDSQGHRARRTRLPPCRFRRRIRWDGPFRRTSPSRCGRLRRPPVRPGSSRPPGSSAVGWIRRHWRPRLPRCSRRGRADRPPNCPGCAPPDAGCRERRTNSGC